MVWILRRFTEESGPEPHKAFWTSLLHKPIRRREHFILDVEVQDKDGLADGPGMWSSTMGGKEQSPSRTGLVEPLGSGFSVKA